MHGPDWIPEALSFPIDPLPGAIILVMRECRFRELGLLSFEKKRQVYTVRAFITDNPNLAYSLDEAVKRPSDTKIELTEDRLFIYNHHGGDRAVYFELVRSASGTLSHLHLSVSATRPEVALGYARAEVNALLDRFTAGSPSPLPLAIQRLELLSPKDGDVIAYQLMIPFSSGQANISKFGGFVLVGLFDGHHSMFREAMTNPSPYYRLLLAYRAFEGIPAIRGRIAKLKKQYGVDEKMPEVTVLDEGELGRLQLTPDVRKLKNINQLFEHYTDLRNGIAHFLLKLGPSNKAHVDLSGIMINTYAIVSALLLKYVRIESGQLERYYQRSIFPHVNRGVLILPQEQYRDKFIVIVPDDAR